MLRIHLLSCAYKLTCMRLAVGFFLLQGPLCRFGDTAANAGMLSVLAEYESTRALPLGVQTAAASAAAATWRMLLLPLDAAKTMMQVRLSDQVDSDFGSMWSAVVRILRLGRRSHMLHSNLLDEREIRKSMHTRSCPADAAYMSRM